MHIICQSYAKQMPNKHTFNFINISSTFSPFIITKKNEIKKNIGITTNNHTHTHKKKKRRNQEHHTTYKNLT